MTAKDKIFFYMDNMGMSQKDFAQCLGVTGGTVSDWKKGRSKSYMSYLPQISRVLDIPISYILDDTSDIMASIRNMPHAESDRNSLSHISVEEQQNSLDYALERFKQAAEKYKSYHEIRTLTDNPDVPLYEDEEREILAKYRQLKAKYPNRKIIMRAIEPDSYEII